MLPSGIMSSDLMLNITVNASLIIIHSCYNHSEFSFYIGNTFKCNNDSFISLFDKPNINNIGTQL